MWAIDHIDNGNEPCNCNMECNCSLKGLFGLQFTSLYSAHAMLLIIFGKSGLKSFRVENHDYGKDCSIRLHIDNNFYWVIPADIESNLFSKLDQKFLNEYDVIGA